MSFFKKFTTRLTSLSMAAIMAFSGASASAIKFINASNPKKYFDIEYYLADDHYTITYYDYDNPRNRYYRYGVAYYDYDDPSWDSHIENCIYCHNIDKLGGLDSTVQKILKEKVYYFSEGNDYKDGENDEVWIYYGEERINAIHALILMKNAIPLFRQVEDNREKYVKELVKTGKRRISFWH